MEPRVGTAGAIRRAKLQSPPAKSQPTANKVQAGCPYCHSTNSIKALKGKPKTTMRNCLNTVFCQVLKKLNCIKPVLLCFHICPTYIYFDILHTAPLWLFSEFGTVYKYSDLLTYFGNNIQSRQRWSTKPAVPMSSLFFGSTARFLRQMAAVRMMMSRVKWDGDNRSMMIGKPLSDRTALRMSAAGCHQTTLYKYGLLYMQCYGGNVPKAEITPKTLIFPEGL